eukprot:1160073-Pelagomonas_calceolata.AAC.4
MAMQLSGSINVKMSTLLTPFSVPAHPSPPIMSVRDRSYRQRRQHNRQSVSTAAQQGEGLQQQQPQPPFINTRPKSRTILTDPALAEMSLSEEEIEADNGPTRDRELGNSRGNALSAQPSALKTEALALPAHPTNSGQCCQDCLFVGAAEQPRAGWYHFWQPCPLCYGCKCPTSQGTSEGACLSMICIGLECSSLRSQQADRRFDVLCQFKASSTH